MYSFKTNIRVRYNETDRMGYLHHGWYPAYLETARTEMLRSIGTSYKEMEDSGIFMPVYDLQIKYKKPAFYDDELIVVSEIEILPDVKMVINYKIYNDLNELICTANTTNVYFSAVSKKVIRAPKNFLNRFKKYF